MWVVRKNAVPNRRIVNLFAEFLICYFEYYAMLYTDIFMSFKEYFHLGVIGFSSHIFLTIADMYMHLLLSLCLFLDCFSKFEIL